MMHRCLCSNFMEFSARRFKMELKQVRRIAVKGGFVLLLLLLLSAACQGVQKTVKPEDRIILLEGGPHSGNWESRMMSLDYQYHNQSGELKLSVRPIVKTKATYAGFKVWVLFVDPQGQILEEKLISSGEDTFPIPPGTTNLSFRTFLESQPYKPPVSR